MQLSKFTDYSLRVLVLAAVRSPGAVSLDEMAAVYDVSRNHLVKVVQRLGQLGWLETKRGPGGGVRLAEGASGVSVGEIVRSTESTLALAECFEASNRCRLTPACRLKGVLAGAQAAFFQHLDGVTLGEISANREPVLRALAPGRHGAAGRARAAGRRTRSAGTRR